MVADYLSRPSSPLTDKQAVKPSPTTVKLPNCQAVKTSPAVAPSVSTYAQVAAGSARPLTVNSSTLVAELDLVALARDRFKDRAEFQHLREDSSLRLELVPIPGYTSKKILCAVSTGVDRPLVPSSWTGKIFSHFHGLHHPGGKSTLREVCLLYTSPSPRDQRGSRMPSSA